MCEASTAAEGDEGGEVRASSADDLESGSAGDAESLGGSATTDEEDAAAAVLPTLV